MAGADDGGGGVVDAPAADGGCLGCMGDAGKITGTVGGGIAVGGSMLGTCWLCWRSPWFKRTTVRIANNEASTGAMQRWRHEVEVNPVAMAAARAAERTYINARQLDKAARLRLQLSIVSGLRQASPMPRSESAPPAEGGHATEGDPATTPPTVESTSASGTESARIATAQSARPAPTGTAPAARRAIPRLRAKDRLAACCGGLAACCGCKALPTDYPSPRHFPGPLPPALAMGTSPRDSGSSPLPGLATGPSPAVRGTPPELANPIPTAARTEGRHATRGKSGPLSEIEIEAALRRAGATRAASRTQHSAAGSSGSQQARLETSAPSDSKPRASAPPKTRGPPPRDPPTPRSLLSVGGRSKTPSAGGDQSPVTSKTGQGPAPWPASPGKPGSRAGRTGRDTAASKPAAAARKSSSSPSAGRHSLDQPTQRKRSDVSGPSTAHLPLRKPRTSSPPKPTAAAQAERNGSSSSSSRSGSSPPRQATRRQASFPQRTETPSSKRQ